MATRPVVYLENSLIDSMLGDAALREEFGACLRAVAAAPAAGGCSKCRKEGRKPASAYAAAKDCFIGLPQPAKDRLKALLDAQQLRVLGAGGREFTF